MPRANESLDRRMGLEGAGMISSQTIGAFHHWRVRNETKEMHPFHIHQVHFLVYAQNGVRFNRAEWLDTANAPVEGNVDLMMDFTDPVIRGISLFYCHLQSHEDKGMMAKIFFKRDIGVERVKILNAAQH